MVASNSLSCSIGSRFHARLLFDGVVPDECGEILTGQRAADEIALQHVTVVGGKEEGLFLGFNPFCNEPDAKRLGHLDDSRYDGGVVGVVRKALDEGLVDLQRFDLKRLR